MKQTALFKVPVYIHSVRDWETVKMYFLNKIDWNDPECQDLMQDDYLNGGYSDFHKYYAAGRNPEYYDELMTILHEPLQEFASMNPGAFVSNAWCQKYPANTWHAAHNHGAVGYSAVFYAQLGRAHKPTSFFSPLIDPWTGQIEWIEPECREGDIIFFPSYLIHQSQPHRAAEDKIIFSFNLHLSGETISL